MPRRTRRRRLLARHTHVREPIRRKLPRHSGYCRDPGRGADGGCTRGVPLASLTDYCGVGGFNRYNVRALDLVCQVPDGQAHFTAPN